MASFNYGKGKWNNYKQLNFQPVISATSLPSGETGYFLIDTQGSTYAYDASKDSMNLIGHKWDQQAINYAKVNSQIFSLSRDNKVYYLNNGAWNELVLPQNQKATQIVSVPLYNIFEVKD